MLKRNLKIWLTGAAVVVIAIATLLIVRACSSPEQPRSYRLTPVWGIENVGLPIAYQAETGTVFLWDEQNHREILPPHNIRAVDARTGKVKWTGAPAGWDVNVDYIRGSKLTSDAIIVESNEQKNKPAIAALNLSDGKVRWKLDTPGKSARPLAVTADVIVAKWDDTTLRGLKAADGKMLWETRVADGCKADEIAGSTALVVVEVLCEKKRYLESFDPGTGKSRWQHSVSIDGSPSADNLEVRDDIAMLRNGERLLILDPDGREMLDAETKGNANGSTATTDDLIIAAYTDKSGSDIVTAIGRKDAKPRWTQRASVSVLSLAQGHLYALGTLPEPLLPIGLYEIDLATGKMAVSPTHLIYAEYDSVVAVIDDVVVSYYHDGHGTPHTSHLAGHKLTPAPNQDGFAGGAIPGAWPSACSLVTVAEVNAKSPAVSYQEQPVKVSVAEVTLPQPALCQYEPSSVTAPVVMVGVAWVGSDAEQAKQVMVNLGKQDCVSVPGIGEEAFEVVVYGYPKPTVELYFRAGARIGKITVPEGQSALARDLAKLAVSRLS